LIGWPPVGVRSIMALPINEFAANPKVFRDHLVIPSARGPAKLGDVVADFQARDFAAMDPAFLALAAGNKPEIGRYWLERTKGGSKDGDLAVMLLWLLCFSPRSLTCQVGAADQSQADELRKACKLILRLNPWLSHAVTIQAWTILNARTDSRCEIIPADVAGSHGARPDLLIVNELSHILREEFVRNLLDNASKVPSGVVVIASNAGFVPSFAYDLRETARTSERWYFSAYQQPAPWLDPAEVEEAKKRNPPLRFQRLFEGKWVRGSGDALSGDDIEDAITEYEPMIGDEADFVFYAGVDIGVSRDHSAVAVVGLSRGRIRLATIRSWEPPRFRGGKIDLAEVETTLLGLHHRFGLAKCLYDPHQCELMAQNLIKQFVPMEGLPFTANNLTAMATTLLQRFHSKTVDLYEDPGLISDLHGFRLIDKGLSGYKLDSARTSAGHGDKGIAFVLALLAADRYPHAPGAREDEMPIVLVPGSRVLQIFR